MNQQVDLTTKLGILGGGQLGRMLIQEAVNFNIHITVLEPAVNAPCADLANNFVVGNFNDYQTVLDFGKTVDVLTIEIEHVNIEALEELERLGKKVFPTPQALRTIQDKGLQKQFYKANNIPTAPFHLIDNAEDALLFKEKGPFMQKLRKGGYDGKGVTPLRTEAEFNAAFNAPSVLEEFVPFVKELAVIVARNESGEIATFPLVEMEFNPEANLVEFIFSPAHVNTDVEGNAKKIATDIANKLEHVGLLAIELFLTADGNLLVNEIAPRPHNSGHHTIEACFVSQYGMHLRAILNMPLGSTGLRTPAVMINLLGEKGFEGKARYENIEEVLHTEGAYIHLYGKEDTKPFRKMGHITVCNLNLEEAKETARRFLNEVKVVS
ncbi:MAG: 5-(carboxyamino)imidazole ribonucleotide synthase [Flavobacteriales bacterium]|jgi:5-(carboxyamino)imidazole ribonucleotide synthase|nr:5-(carboxyamino)imidazole ribonucleotide synthase [Flavobacteriales bacterium]MDP4717238.1 5-(carboxyamino)imidazole ribonucleotide synthase [Flavobacteriales bacterium]MDP4818741.1 5-(carboxyamino)imidazole ribonucleotide synthase [Flavobacteriales bacterium]MDP4950655.1 5-(carboxyamino)imidazole ribonucleotide synthase [Flavobacteriales bacterium]